MDVKNDVGCGFIGHVFFQLMGSKPRKAVTFQSNQLDSSKPLPVPDHRVIKPRRSNYREKRVSDAARTSTSSSSNTSGSNKGSQKVVNCSYTKKLTDEPSIFSPCELSLTLPDKRKSNTNVKLLGHLGNLKQQQGKVRRNDKKDIMKNINKEPVEKIHGFGNIFHKSRNRLNPDIIKSLGNEKYKQGKYEEALTWYNQAITIDPTKACYYSNKSAALIGLGRFLEAVVQSKEAIHIDSSYHNAHFRLANLYLRLGLPEKAVDHYKCSGHKGGPKDIAQAEALRTCIDKCIQAQNREDWNKLIDESETAISLGADLAPMIYAMKADALVKLQRHEEAYRVVQKLSGFSNELCAGIFGSSATAGFLVVRAQVYMYNGRFEDGVSDVEQALTLDSGNKVKRVVERVKCVALARSKGNELFKGSRITEALIAYNQGLENDPYNSILLCNRAACRSRLGQYEKAVEDCTVALLVRPNYRKAKLRRANCNAMLEKWEAAIQDYEVLVQELEEEQVRAALLEAMTQWNIRLTLTKKTPFIT